MSGKDRGKPDRARSSDKPGNPDQPQTADHAGTPARSQTKGKKQRPADVGRALRTVYDDTLRESVPDEFMDLLGKLS